MGFFFGCRRLNLRVAAAGEEGCAGEDSRLPAEDGALQVQGLRATKKALPPNTYNLMRPWPFCLPQMAPTMVPTTSMIPLNTV